MRIHRNLDLVLGHAAATDFVQLQKEGKKKHI